MSTEFGLESGKVKLAEHNKEWARVFADEKKLLAQALQKSAAEVEHVGSTAIPTIVSKPIIDIVIGVPSFERLQNEIGALTKLQYHYRGECGIPGRHFLTKGDPTRFHIHLVERSSSHFLDMVLFKEYLCSNYGAAKRYEELKLKLEKEFATDRDKYTESKGPLISELLSEAKTQ